MSNKDGGPAFPFKCQGETTAPETYYGMSLRDWFAGQALAGIIAEGGTGGNCQDDARQAYRFADAMIERR